MYRKVLLKCEVYSKSINFKNAHLSYLISIKTKIYNIPIKFLKKSYGNSKYNLLTMFFQVLNLLKYI